MTKQATITQTIKDELIHQPVTVKVGKTVYSGVVAGRLLPFAHVWFKVGSIEKSFEVAWETVQRAVQNGTSINY